MTVNTELITDYWWKFYHAEHCTLCGNSGIIDTRGVRTRAGVEVGRINFCICPNGQLRRAGDQQRDTWHTCSKRLPTQDGEEFLVCGNDTSPPWYAVAAFNAERGCFEDDTIGISPTHWTHLPAAPGSET
jgi:hypothetical protein